MSDIDLQWREDLAPVLAALNERLTRHPRFNTLFTARALLRLLQECGGNVTAEQVIDDVYLHDRPPGRDWVDFDRDRWLQYVPMVVEVLQSDNPMAVLRL